MIIEKGRPFDPQGLQLCFSACYSSLHSWCICSNHYHLGLKREPPPRRIEKRTYSLKGPQEDDHWSLISGDLLYSLSLVKISQTAIESDLVWNRVLSFSGHFQRCSGQKLCRSSSEKMWLLRSNSQSQIRRLVWGKTSSGPIQSSLNVKENRKGKAHQLQSCGFIVTCQFVPVQLRKILRKPENRCVSWGFFYE